MINLIPPSAKKKIITEYWARTVSVWFYIWASALLLGAFVMVPVYVLVDLQVSNSSESAASAEAVLASYDDLSKQLNSANIDAKSLLESRRYGLLSDYTKLFFELENSDVSLSQVSISRAKDGIGPVQISGSATTRQALASFREALLDLSKVESVDLPISNLAKDKDIQFTLTVKIKKT
jgi:hypothetical protein